MVVYQLGALAGIARRAGHRVTHMSFHGALGNMAAADAALAGPLVRAVAEFDPALTVLTSASRAIEGAAERTGCASARCFLADRAYDTAGLLVSRKLDGAVIHDPDAVVARVRRLLADGTWSSPTVAARSPCPAPPSCCTATRRARCNWAGPCGRQCWTRAERSSRSRVRPHHRVALSAHRRIVLARSHRVRA